MKDTFQIPKAVVGRIIGRGGANIRELQDNSGARVDLDDTNDPQFSLVTLHGTAAAMALAREEINSMVEQFGSPEVNTHSRARAAVSESTVNESTILIIVDECTDSEEAGFFYAEDFRTFVGWICHASSGFRCHDGVCHKEYADDRECAKLRPMRRVLVTLVSQLFQLKNTRAHADLVNKWVDGDIDGVAVVTLFTHFFTHRDTYLDGLSEQTNPLQRLLDSAFVAYKMIK